MGLGVKCRFVKWMILAILFENRLYPQFSGQKISSGIYRIHVKFREVSRKTHLLSGSLHTKWFLYSRRLQWFSSHIFGLKRVGQVFRGQTERFVRVQWARPWPHSISCGPAPELSFKVVGRDVSWKVSLTGVDWTPKFQKKTETFRRSSEIENDSFQLVQTFRVLYSRKRNLLWKVLIGLQTFRNVVPVSFF